MKLPDYLSDPRRVPAYLAAALLLAFIFLFFRNAGIYPIVFIDEWSYSSATRMLPMADAPVPSYLYFQLFKLTNYCGDSYLDCNRLLNTLLYVLASPCIYLLARRVAPAWPSALIALAAVLAPNNAYTPFFMPEAMYYCAFWILSWAALYLVEQPSARRALLLGLLLGATILVKLHALFLIPALALFVLYAAHAQGGKGWIGRGLLWAGVMLAGALALRFALGYLLAGPNGLDLFGTLYAGQAAYTAKSHYPIIQLLGFAWHNLQGHLMLLAALFAVPLAALCGAFNFLRPAHAQEQRLQAITVYSVLMLGSLLGLTIMFTASITGLAVSDTSARIHTRYYDFALPLLLLCAAAAAYAPARPLKTPLRLLIGAVLLLLLWHCRAHLLLWFTPGVIDTPELRVLSMRKDLFNIIVGLSLLSVLAWIYRQQFGLRLFLLLVLPLTTLICAWGTAHEVRLSRWADPASKAGLFAHHYLSREQSDRMVIVGSDIAVLHRARFFVENPRTELLSVPANQPMDWSQVAEDRQWVLAIGQFQPPPDARVIGRKDELLLFQKPAKSALGQRIGFSQSFGDYGRIDGLAWPDTWGAWSQEPQVTMEYGRALPKRMTLRFEGRAFGPNIDKDVIVTVGAQQQVMRIPAANGKATLHFETDGQTRIVTFKIPQPTSQAMLGLSQDTRQFGIGFEYITITDDDAH
ncbi:glycosyltransferase family 39 protein [Duganella sp. BuS-21]|uniref:DUF7024 domain-containing protein n=1 Tax=Duganella sp. BuS-21 TaxID=2943848 RepID=UPI0035A6302E